MKILHVVNGFSEGGVESLLLELLPRVAKMGHQIDLLVLNRKAVALADVIEQEGVRVIVGKYNNVYDPRNIWLIKSYVKNYDIVHTHLFPTQLYGAMAKIICRVKAPFFTSEHGSYNNRRKHKFFHYIDKWFYGKYDKIVAVSPTVQKSLLQWANVDSEVVCNGINLERFQSKIQSPISRMTLGFSESDKVLIMVARFGLPKDHDTVIKSLCQLGEEYKVIFVGSGDRMNICKELAKELGVDQRVLFIGNYPAPEDYITISDVCVLCTDNEGLSISVMEYSALGKPVVVSDIDAMRDNFSGYVEMVEPHNEVAFAQIVRAIIESPELYAKMVEHSLNCAKKYDINNTAKQYCQLYNRATNG